MEEHELDKPVYLSDKEFVKLSFYNKSEQVTEPVTPPVSNPVEKVINALSNGHKSSSELRNIIGIKHRNTFRKNYLHPALEAGYIEYTIPENPGSRLQQYCLTAKGEQYTQNT